MSVKKRVDAITAYGSILQGIKRINELLEYLEIFQKPELKSLKRIRARLEGETQAYCDKAFPMLKKKKGAK